MSRYVKKPTRYEKKIAEALGVTPTGLQVLAMAVATGGELKRSMGTAAVALAELGLVERRAHDRDVITDAGREIVRKARAWGW